jgi:hypothetical protein
MNGWFLPRSAARMHLCAIASATDVQPIAHNCPARRKIMLKFIKVSAVCAVLGIAALAGGAPAQADALYFGTGHNGLRVVVRDHDGPRWNNNRHYRPVRFCSTDRALDKARRMGVRRAHVAYQNRSVIGVKGYDRRGRIMLTFGRSASCPLIR